MAKKDKGFMFFFDWRPAVECLPAEDVQALLLAMIDFAADGTPPPEFSGMTKLAASFLFPAIRRYKESVINGQKGGEMSTGKAPQAPPREPPQEGTTTTIRYDTNTDNDTVTIQSGNDTSFESFWSAYLRKVRKTTAQQAWEQLKPDATHCATIMRALEQQKRSVQWQKDNGQFIPYPAKWLEEHRWEDKLPEAPITGAGTFDTDEFAAAALAKTLRDFADSDD